MKKGCFQIDDRTLYAKLLKPMIYKSFKQEHVYTNLPDLKWLK